MTPRRRRTVAWIALAAMLFGAVSPAIAALLFPDRPDVLGRLLAIPAPGALEKAQPADIIDDYLCHQDGSGSGRPHSQASHHGAAGHDTHDDAEHAAHGVFCSFCLPATSVVTLLSAGLIPLPLAAGTDFVGGPEGRSAQAAPSLHRARGPPALSR